MRMQDVINVWYQANPNEKRPPPTIGDLYTLFGQITPMRPATYSDVTTIQTGGK